MLATAMNPSASARIAVRFNGECIAREVTGQPRLRESRRPPPPLAHVSCTHPGSTARVQRRSVNVLTIDAAPSFTQLVLEATYMRAILAAVMLATSVVACGGRTVEVQSAPAPASDAAVNVTNNLSE